MATKVIDVNTCDDCEADDLHEVLAPHQYVLSINGGPFKRLDFCAPCDRAVGRLLKLYEEQGEELKIAAGPEPEDKPPTRTVTARRKPQELEQAPLTAETAPEETAAPVAKAKKRGQFIICTEPHPSNGGKSLKIEYGNRATHTKACHPGMEIHDIEWGDPDKILRAPCTSHAACMRTGLAFTGGTGAATHVRNSTLPRIDQNETADDRN